MIYSILLNPRIVFLSNSMNFYLSQKIWVKCWAVSIDRSFLVAQKCHNRCTQNTFKKGDKKQEKYKGILLEVKLQTNIHELLQVNQQLLQTLMKHQHQRRYQKRNMYHKKATTNYWWILIIIIINIYDKNEVSKNHKLAW